MSRRCPNCDQRLLEDEQVCWHCGAQLELPPAPEPAHQAPASSEEASERPLLLYGALTACITLAALLLTSFLGRQPRFQIAAVPLPEGWVIATDDDRSLSVFLPQDWDRQSAAAVLAETVAAQSIYSQALQPLAGFVDDEQIVFLATGPRPETFLVAAHSVVLNRLSPADAVAFAAGDSVTLLEAREIENRGVAQASLRIELDDSGIQKAHCRQRFMRGEQAALLFSLCAPPGRLDEETAERILLSVQRLH